MEEMAYFDLFMWKFGLGKNVRLETTRDQPELARYYDYIGSLGSTFMDPEGQILITIHDAGGATTSTWFEELMHAKQYLDRGQISVGIGGTSDECELEVAECLVNNAAKLALSGEEVDRAQRAHQYYSNRVQNG